MVGHLLEVREEGEMEGLKVANQHCKDMNVLRSFSVTLALFKAPLGVLKFRV